MIPHPLGMGGFGSQLRFVTLTALMELKLIASRAIDDADIVELIQLHSGEMLALREHLFAISRHYAKRFDALVESALNQIDH
jgi:hypothetical protein